MVRLSLTFLSVATAFAVASAMPPFAQQPFKKITTIALRKCLDTHIRVYQPFLITNRGLGSFVSKQFGSNHLIADVNGDTDQHRLEFSVVPFEDDKDMQGPGDCIYEDTLYRFIVRGSYGHGSNLQVDNGFLIIVPEFGEATPLYFYPSASGGVHIGQRTPSGPLVMATVEPGEPLSFEQPKSGLDRQVFDLLPRINDINKKSGPRMCLPGTDIKVFEPFLIRNHALESFISWSRRVPVVVGGKASGGGGLQPLHVSVVPLDKGELATEEISDDCILEDVDYLFKIHAPFAGYLRATKQYLTIVGNAKDASRLYLHKSAGQGLRIALHSPDGALVVATTEPSRPLVFERPESKNERQVFDLVPLNSNEKIE